VWSPALGGQWVKTMVFLPPGYQRSSTTRYPVLYWLHGLHSQGFSLLTVTGAAADEDVLVAQKRIKPLIIVIPSGGWRLDTEWADGVAPNSSWETFVARDLTRAIDQRFRTIATRAGRAIGGLSEGGYGALNIALHHPDTFGFVESWSGYTIADPTSHVFGTDQRRLDYNSPLYEVSAVAPTLIRNHDYFWFYVGNEDPYRAQNAAFAAALTRLRVPHGYFSVRGVHSWRLWRRFMVESLLVLSAHISDVTA
jgi:S-formylglutathione hydrolase FrmB